MSDDPNTDLNPAPDPVADHVAEWIQGVALMCLEHRRRVRWGVGEALYEVPNDHGARILIHIKVNSLGPTDTK